MELRPLTFAPDFNHGTDPNLGLSQGELLGLQVLNSKQPAPYQFLHNDGFFFSALFGVIIATFIATNRPPIATVAALEQPQSITLKLKFERPELKPDDTAKTEKTIKTSTQAPPSVAPQTKKQTTKINKKPVIRTTSKGKLRLNMAIPNEWPDYIDAKPNGNKHSDVFDQKLRSKLNSPYIERLNSRRKVVDKDNYESVYNDVYVSDGTGNCFKVIDNQGEEMWLKSKCRSEKQTFKFGRLSSP